MPSTKQSHGKRGRPPKSAQTNRVVTSLNDLVENETGENFVERSIQDHSRDTREKVIVRRPRSTRGRPPRTEQSNIQNSSNDSAERHIVRGDTSRTNENNSANISTESVDVNKKKRARGPTCMPKVWGLNKQLDVTFNELGQPNDQKRTSTLAHFLGTIARNGSFCPLNYTDWRLIPDSYKDDMLKEVKSRFTLHPGSDSFILKSINHKWRNWKCQLKNLNFDPSVSIEDQLLKVPDRVNVDQYKKMLDYWVTNKAQQLSVKKKDARAKVEIIHRMGKRSYAVMSEIMNEHMGRYPTRAELFEKCCYPSDGSPSSEAVLEAIEKMKELAAQNDGNTSDSDVMHNIDDDFAKVMGKDKDGRLRMYGLGVKPSDIYGGRPSRDALYRKSMEEREEIRTLRQKIDELTALVHKNSHLGQSKTQGAVASSPINHTSSLSISRSSIRVGVYVKLKSLVHLNEFVATGIVKSIGDVVLNGRDLGPGICEVVVQSILKDEELLIYPTDLHETIGHSIGAPIAWPLSLIVLDEDEN